MRLNIGEIGAGAVKHVIDWLYPLIGVTPGVPADWRIVALQVEQGCAEVPLEAVQVTVRQQG